MTDNLTTNASNEVEIPTLLVGGVIPRCSSCHFWRDSGWDGDDGIGKCINPFVIAQVSMMSEELIERFVSGDTDKDRKSNARFLANSLRFSSHFGCVHYNGV